jgi:hypothetical protein
MAKKMKKPKTKPKRKPRLDFAQQVVANVERIIGGKLSDGMSKRR